ncbi:MAG: helix-turn-helix domain-containing protein [Deltaproteobacteria bacterium]|nr:helix-turn-helix domain-containing protein [Deltaproteobacteria bacterium]
MDQILTAAEVAALLQVHIRTVYRLAAKAVIPGNRIGRGWRFRKDEIVALVSSRRKRTPREESTASVASSHKRSGK